MPTWFKSNSSTIWSWAVLIAAAVIVFVLSINTEYRQLGTALLLSVVSLLVAMAIFEAIWCFAVKASNPGESAGNNRQPDRGRR